MTSPLVSVLVPVYDVEEYLPQCLDSIIGQSYTNLEIICVNDGSTDNSLSILYSYARLDSRIRIINQTNKGLSAVRDVAIAAAQGKYSMIVDSDDWIDSNTIEDVVHVAEQENLDVVFFPYISEHLTHSDKHPLWANSHIFDKQECANLSKRMIGPTGKEFTNVLALDSCATVWGKLYKSVLLKPCSSVSTQLIGTAEDALLNAECMRSVRSAAYMDSCWYHYRKSRPTQLTNSYKPKLFEQVHRLYELMGQFVDEEIKAQALQNRIACNLFGLGYNATDPSLALSEQYVHIREILEDDTFHTALCRVEVTYLPIYWKFFLYAGRQKRVTTLLCMMKIFRLLMR